MSTHGIVAAFENLQQRLEKRRVEKKDLRKAQEDLCWLQNELDNRLSEDHKGREKRLRKDRRAAKEEYAKQRNDG